MTIRLNGSTSGYVEIDAPAVAGTGALTLPSGTGTLLTAEGGKILQVVRATDTVQRSTTSTSFVDASISVTITPQKNTSAIILIWTANAYVFVASSSVVAGFLQISDNSNNAIPGAKRLAITLKNGTELNIPSVLIGYATPATTSATTFKGRFRANPTHEVGLINALTTAQLYAIEVSA